MNTPLIRTTFWGRVWVWVWVCVCVAPHERETLKIDWWRVDSNFCMNVSQRLIWLGSFLGRFTLKTAKNTILTANYDLKFCRVTLKHKYVSALCHNIHFLVVHKWMSCLMRWYHRKNGQKCTSNGISRWYPMVNVCQYHISIITRKSLFLNQSNIS